MKNPDYKDALDYEKRIESTLLLSPLSPSSSNNEYHQLLTTNHTTKHILNQNSHFYAANDETKRKELYIFGINATATLPDQMPQEIKENMTLSKVASNNFIINFTHFKIMLLLKLLLTFRI